MPEITLSIHGHAEGALLIHSLRSAEAACRFAEERGLDVELLILLDSPTAETVAVAKQHRYAKTRMETVDHRDLGLSRNSAVSLSTSKYIAFLDGDDLISTNWLAAAHDYYTTLDGDQYVLHTEVMVGVHDENWVRFQIESDQQEFNPFELTQNWFYCNNSFAPRSIYQKLPFHRSQRDRFLGGEDWKWSADSLIEGLVHHYVPQTAYYYRRQQTRSSLGHTKGIVVMPSELFKPKNARYWGVKNYFPSAEESSAQPARYDEDKDAISNLDALYKSLIDLPIGQSFGFLPTRSTHVTIRPYPPEEWLLKDWKAQHSFDYRVYPSKERLQNLPFFYPRIATRGALALMLVLSKIKGDPAAVLMAPFFRHGGGNRMVVAYLNALHELYPDEPVVLLRLRSEETNYDGLNENVVVIEFSKILESLAIPYSEYLPILVRTLVETGPRIFWTINNDLGLNAVAESGTAISVFCGRVTSIFGPGLTVDGYAGYAVTRVPSLAAEFDMIVADNQAIIDLLVDRFALPPEKFQLCPAPSGGIEFRPSGKADASPQRNGKKTRILWYSRLDYEKRVDLLIEIARSLQWQGFEFVVYGTSVVNDHEVDYLSQLKSLPNVDYRGEFKDLEELPFGECDAYLYTSSSDGFPFVLLEAAVKGIPIVASDVGGISEVITDETGYLVRNPDDPKAYADALRQIRSNHAEALNRTEKLQDFLLRERSFDKFAANVSAVVEKAGKHRSYGQSR